MIQIVSGGEVDVREDFREEKARQSSESAGQKFDDGRNPHLFDRASYANYVCS